MPMNPRLLRPRQTIHPEAADWANRVRANGGSVSGATLSAVDRFCKAITAAGIRDRFLRLNLFCGGTSGTAAGLNSALVPLYRGQSQAGPLFGNTTDINNGPFLPEDYNETGATGGLSSGASNSTKYLATGVAQNALTAASRHLAFYEIAATWGAFQSRLGADNGVSVNPFLMTTFNTTNTMRYLASSGGTAVVSPTYSGGGGLWCGTGTATDAVLYRNGSFVATASIAAATPGSELINVFAMSRSGSPSDYSSVRMGGYSIGLGLTASQALAYHNAVQAFQTALQRNV